MKRILCITVVGLGLTALVDRASAKDTKPVMPPLMTQPNAEMVAFEHIDALNKCDWNRLMAQYPEEILFILPNGTWVEGRTKIGGLFAGFCKDRKDGGFKGAIFIAEKVKTVGDTV